LDFPLLFQGTAYPIQTACSTERIIANCMNRAVNIVFFKADTSVHKSVKKQIKIWNIIAYFKAIVEISFCPSNISIEAN
jgi:hypothetical protein